MTNKTEYEAKNKLASSSFFWHTSLSMRHSDLNKNNNNSKLKNYHKFFQKPLSLDFALLIKIKISG